MVEFKVKTRPTGAMARLSGRGQARVESRTGGSLEVVTAVAEPGFNPLDLLYASLAACLVLSVKGAVTRLHLTERFDSVEAEVTGTKAEVGPARVETLHCLLRVQGRLTVEEGHAIKELAKELCTVSNTLGTPPTMDLVLETA